MDINSLVSVMMTSSSQIYRWRPLSLSKGELIFNLPFIFQKHLIFIYFSSLLGFYLQAKYKSTPTSQNLKIHKH